MLVIILNQNKMSVYNPSSVYIILIEKSIEDPTFKTFISNTFFSIHIHNDNYLLKSDLKPSEIRSMINKYIGIENSLLIIDITKSAWASRGIMPSVTGWMKRYNPRSTDPFVF